MRFSILDPRDLLLAFFFYQLWRRPSSINEAARFKFIEGRSMIENNDDDGKRRAVAFEREQKNGRVWCVKRE